MILTEAEAREKWCPESRDLNWQRMDQESGSLAAAAVNRHHGAHDADNNETVIIFRRYRCIASGCMFWRWFDHVTDDGTLCAPMPTAHLARSPDKERPLTERRGYCGKAGKP